MLKRITVLILGLTFFIASCQAVQVSEATATENPPTPTQQAVVVSETPEPTQTALPAVPEMAAKCFTTADSSPIAFMPDSTRILIQDLTPEGSGIRIINLETMEEETSIPTPHAFGPMALSPDGEVLAWALDDNTIQLTRLADGKLLKTLEGHTGPVYKLRFSASGDRLFSASMDRSVRIWDRHGEPVDAFEPIGADNLPNEIQGIGISPDGTMLGSIPFDGPTRVWNLADKTEIVNLGGTGGDVTSDINFSADGRFVAADQAGRLSLWRTSDWTQVWTGVNSLAFAFSPDSRFLAYSDMGDNFHVKLRSLDGTDETRILEGEQTNIYNLLFSPDGALLASAAAGIQIWQVETGQIAYIGKSSCP
jgi:WD40 repeat protein